MDKVQVSGGKTEGSVLTLPYYYESGFELPKEVQEEIKKFEQSITSEHDHTCAPLEPKPEVIVPKKAWSP